MPAFSSAVGGMHWFTTSAAPADKPIGHRARARSAAMFSSMFSDDPSIPLYWYGESPARSKPPQHLCLEGLQRVLGKVDPEQTVAVGGNSFADHRLVLHEWRFSLSNQVGRCSPDKIV